MLKYINVIAVCDNDKNVRMQKIGLPIMSVEDAAKVYKNAIYVIANKNCAESLKNQLMSMGISEKQIVSFLFFFSCRWRITVSLPTPPAREAAL